MGLELQDTENLAFTCVTHCIKFHARYNQKQDRGRGLLWRIIQWTIGKIKYAQLFDRQFE
jgi:hypothetical protein